MIKKTSKKEDISVRPMQKNYFLCCSLWGAASLLYRVTSVLVVLTFEPKETLKYSREYDAETVARPGKGCWNLKWIQEIVIVSD